MVPFWHPSGTLNAQTDNRLSCVALVKNDSIMLRWAPASISLWQAGLKYGYIVKRYTIARDGVFLPDGLNNATVLTESPVKAYVEEHFEKLSYKDPRASVIQEAIFGKESLPGTGNEDFNSFIKSYEDKEVRLGFALFMCDLSPALARAAGLLFTDTSTSKGERYAYSIIPAEVPEGTMVEPTVIVVDAGIPTILPSIIDVQAVFTDRAVRFRWPLMINKGIYSAFILEKSYDGKVFSPVSDLPLVNFSEKDEQDYFIYTDSLKSNDERVWYRVRGISPFGETGPPSEIVSGKGVAEFSAYASIDTAWVNEGKSITINWRVTEGEGSKLKEINLLRSGNHNGPFLPINRKPLSANVRTFSDNNPGQNNYYQIKLSGEENLNSHSFPYFIQTEDNSPPATPVMLSGNVDSTGRVTVIWKENSETDLMGYKVFRANSKEDEFIALSQGIIPANICKDSISLNTLTKKIFYQVVAIDKNYNSSEYSSILELSRPDTIMPSPATIKHINCSMEKVSISFVNSPSNDVTAYQLFRLNEGDSIPVKTAEWKILPDAFMDVFTGKYQELEYRLVTSDYAGNSSTYRRTVYAGTREKNSLKLTATQSADGRTITVSWELPAGFHPGKTIIYRSTASNPVTIYKTIPGGEMLFVDEDIEINSGYTYRILVFSAGMDEQISSDELKFTASSASKRKD